MQDFVFDIVYRPGAQGAHIDYLNRNSVECMLINITDREWFKVAQMQDPDLEVLRKFLETGDVQSDTKQYFDKGLRCVRSTNLEVSCLENMKDLGLELPPNA